MVAQKRSAPASPPQDSKRPKTTSAPRPVFTSALLQDETDFPRGGGTSLTPLEYKQVRDEGRKEADAEVEQEKAKRKAAANRRKKGKTEIKDNAEKKDKDAIRVEHLNYKRLTAGTRVLARVHSILNLHLVLSLPNQLLAHVPITEITETLTHLLTKDEDSAASMQGDDDEDEDDNANVPDLHELFTPGQYVLATAQTLHASESSNRSFLSMYPPSEVTRLASRVEMSLIPAKVHAEVSKLDVTKGYRVRGEVRAEEDHGWIVGLGIEGLEGFLAKDLLKNQPVVLGQLIDAVVTSSNNRIVQLTIDTKAVSRSQQFEVTTVSSLLPGHTVQALITAIVPSTGLNLKISGSFDSTIDHTHLPIPADADIEESYKVGKKVKARIIFEATGASGNKVFGLSLLPHILDGVGKLVDNVQIEEKFRIGTIVDDVKVERVEKEWGLVCATPAGVAGYVHISHVADTRPASLAGSGPYREGSTHKARVIGHSPFDGVVLFSFEKKVIDQKFMRVEEIKVGEIMKGTVNKLTDRCMFVNVSGSIDAIVWPLHYADIKLKNPEKRFKINQSVRARVFSIEPEKGRLRLTLKKTLVDSKEETVQSVQEMREGMNVAGVVTKVFEKGCLVEVFSGAVVYIPVAEVSDAYISDLKTAGYEGKPVKVKLTSVNKETEKLFGSIRQALPGTGAASSPVSVEDVVSGRITVVHQDQVVLSLSESGRKALLNLGNLAHFRSTKIETLRKELKVGETLEDLIVVAQNEDTGLVIVTNKQKVIDPNDADVKEGTSKELSMASLKVGQVIPARVVSSNPLGYFLRISKHVKGRLHVLDSTDDLSTLKELDQGAIVNCSVIQVDAGNSMLDLSTRPSRLDPSSAAAVVDQEVTDLSSLKVNQKIRGVVKSVAATGVFVALGRSITARIMIKELFDDFVAEWQPRFKVGQVVEGKILSVDEKKGLCEMTLRKKARAKGKKESGVGLADLKEGDKVDTVVRKTEPFGLFLRIKDTSIDGLCHRSEIADEKDADVAQALKGFREGDKLKAKILKIDLEKGKVSLGIKPSYFDTEDFGGQAATAAEDVDMDDEEDSGNEDEDESMEDGESIGSQEEGEDESDEAAEDEDEDELDGSEDAAAQVDSDEEADSDEEEVIMLSGQKPTKAIRKKSTADSSVSQPIKAGFSWTGTEAAADAASDESSDESSDEDEEVKGKASKKRKSNQPIKDLTGEIRTKQPESISEFERALLASPNSSFLWIQFMSFQLALSEIDRAREIGRKALKTIAFREETEKLNVWMALINLENAHGTQDSFDKLFKEAAQYNDAKTIYLRTASVLQQTEKLDQSAELYKKACKKFGQSPEAWISSAEFEFVARDDAEAARAILPRSLKTLPTAEHAKMIEDFAILEFRHGDQERGRTIYEGLLDRYPKKLNLWNNYVDQITRLGDIQAARGLIDRALDHKLTAKRAKFLFKKLFFVEDRIGDEAGKDRAKAKAREWVLNNQD